MSSALLFPRCLMQSPVLISILSGLCGRALLGFPALAGQEYGAWNLVIATGVRPKPRRLVKM